MNETCGMGPTDTELVQILSDLKYLPPEKLQAAEAQAKQERVSLYDTLLLHEYMSEDELGKVVAYHYDLPFVSLQNVAIGDGLLHLAPKTVVERFQTIPFQLDKEGLHIATAQPDATDLFEMLAKKAGVKQYRAAYTTELSIKSALHLYKKKLPSLFNALINRNPAAAPVNEIIDMLFEYGYDAHASDVHIEPQEDKTVVRFRIDGVLHDEVTFPKAMHDQVINRLKVMARLRTDEHFRAQDGRLRTKVGGEELSIRISIVPVITGEKVVMRLLAKHARQFSMADLGMSPGDLKKLQNGFTRPFGMVLSTGPTGSGKTTTIYSILKILNTRDRNIATIEDPIEYVLNGINQIQANTKTGLTFSSGLRSLLRQDPDVLFVGEVRDEETASIGVNAAMTGHLVLSTMHTNDAVTTLPRLVDMGIEPFLAGSTVSLIIGQRLVRQICGQCKVSLELKKTPLGWAGEDPFEANLLNSLDAKLMAKYFGKKTSVRVYKGNGCGSCHDTGYQGRFGIFELLEVTPKLAQLIAAKVDSDALQAQAVKDGMVTMTEDGILKVIAGKTTLSEILRVTRA